MNSKQELDCDCFRGGQKMKIRGKLLITQLILLAVTCGGLGGFAVLNSTNAVIAQMESGLREKSLDSAMFLEERFRRSFAELEGITAHDTIRSMEWERQKEYLEQEMENLDYLTLAIVNPDGIANYLDGSTLELGDRDYVKQAFAGESAMSEIIISRATNEPVMMLASPIREAGAVVGVLIARIDGYYLSEIVDGIKFGGTGYAYILNGDGTFLGHGNRELVKDQVNYIERAKEDPEMENNAEITARIVRDDEGIFNYTYEGVERYASFVTLNNEWKLVVGAYADEAMSGLKSLQILLLVFTGGALTLGIIVAYFLANSLSRPIQVVTETGKKLAEGDFTTTISKAYMERSDEVGDLAKTFSAITANMRNMLSQVNDSALRVDEAVEEMTAKARTTTEMVQETNVLIQGVSETAEMQLISAQESATSMQEMAVGSQRVAEIASEVAGSSSEIQQRADLGEELLGQAVEQMVSIQEGALGTSKVMDELKEASEEVTQITQMISDISEQTNLLALNASIEAARAGESGKGFSVVADEIRKLSEQTATSASEISRLIVNIQDDTTIAVKSTHESQKDVEKGIELMTTLKNDFQIIFEALDQIHERMNDLSSLSEEMSAGTEEVSAAVEEMSATSQEATNHVNKVTAKTNEQLKTVEDIHIATNSLKEMAMQLKQAIEQFKM